MFLCIYSPCDLRGFHFYVRVVCPAYFNRLQPTCNNTPSECIITSTYFNKSVQIYAQQLPVLDFLFHPFHLQMLHAMVKASDLLITGWTSLSH